MFPFLDTSSGIRLFISAADAQTADAFLDALPSPDASSLLAPDVRARRAAEELRDTNFDGAFDLTIQYDPFRNLVATNAFILLASAAP
jgi:hypothetical protein